MTELIVQEIDSTDPKDLAAMEGLLLSEPIRHAYLLGYLKEGYQSACKWLGSFDSGGRLTSIVLIYSGLARSSIFTAGRADGIRAILQSSYELLPISVKAHIDGLHSEAFETRYRENGGIRKMIRMGLSLSDYHDNKDDLSDGPEVVALTHRDTAAIIKLFGHWEDHFFEPYQLEDSLYFGIKDDEGDLLCIAGTHNVSTRYSVVSIGNLITAPHARGQGLARRCTARLLRGAFARVRLVSLDAQFDHAPSTGLYSRFGFKQHADIFEGRYRILSDS